MVYSLSTFSGLSGLFRFQDCDQAPEEFPATATAINVIFDRWKDVAAFVANYG
jgi:hypothetical protein